jgi:sarcosine oxidase subunit alpha
VSGRRLEAGPAELIDRTKPASFRFDGRSVSGFEGDTIASALASSGIDVVSRSFKYHRPRGLLCCAGRCPNCIVDVDGTPNVRACMTPVRDGLNVHSQNARPSLRWDLMSLADRFDRLLPIGFYYKTFIRPRRLWPFYERVLRSVAGLGRLNPRKTPDVHPRKRHLHADVCVVGGGPSGCLAALEAAAAGARVVLVDDEPTLGGHLRYQSAATGGDERLAASSGFEASARLGELVAGDDRIEHLASASAIGIYEGGLVGVAQGDTFIRIRAARVVVCTGAAETPMLFDANDRPGVMLASAILRLRHLHGVAAGRRAVVLTDDDHGWRAAAELSRAGIGVAALVDARPQRAAVDEVLLGELRHNGVEVLASSRATSAVGRSSVTGVRLLTPAGARTIECDLIAMASRPEPVISLLAQAGAVVLHDQASGRFVAQRMPAGVLAAGHVLGRDLPDGGLVLGAVDAGRRAASGTEAAEDTEASAAASSGAEPVGLALGSGRKQFVCVCEDVTVKDLALGVQEGFRDIETLKRYSTVTMGPCQGKMCHTLSARVHAVVAGDGAAAPRLTTSRPPWQPVTLASLAGPHLAPVRRTAMHERHAALGATWIDMGDWKRPLHYGDVDSECRAVRTAAGVIDVSTLGKLMLQGPDAGAFLDWLHPNRFSDLREGRVRYRAMLDDAGIVLDDGTVARLAGDRYFVSTTTGNLDAMDQWFRWWLADGTRQASVVNVTSQYAAINLAGPRARDVLAPLTELDVSREKMPYLSAAEGAVAGIPAILLRIGFVGELGFEIHVPADYGAHLWDVLVDAGREHGLRAFGVEAQRVLRLEKQHPIVGQDTDALSDPIGARMGWLVKADKPDFVGRDALASVSGLVTDGRPTLVGFEVSGRTVPAEGAAIVRNGRAIGRVTSSKWSPTLDRTIGLAWLATDAAAEGSDLTIRLGDGGEATVAGVVRTRAFYDPDGERLRT